MPLKHHFSGVCFQNIGSIVDISIYAVLLFGYVRCFFRFCDHGGDPGQVKADVACMGVSCSAPEYLGLWELCLTIYPQNRVISQGIGSMIWWLSSAIQVWSWQDNH